MSMKTKVLVEHSAGDTMKVVAFQLDDLFEKDNLQTDEINSIVKARIENSVEVEEISKSRPRASKNFKKNYHSGNLYTLTKSKHEKNVKNRLDVINECFFQMQEYDGLSKDEFIALCESYVREHFDDGEEVGSSVSDTP